MSTLDDVQIIHSWNINAAPWIKAIQNNEIESRNLITNQAVLETVTRFSTNYILDVGCGEGWLVRALMTKGIRVFGIDAVPALIEQANKNCKTQFDVCLYENFHQYNFKERFDCIICNFSLIGKESTENVIKHASSLLQENGRLIIQTLHPLIACGDFKYIDGWRVGSWTGFSDDFTDPPPWYFRTIESWNTLLNDNGFKHIKIYEPIHPKTHKPASILFECFLKS